MKQLVWLVGMVCATTFGAVVENINSSKMTLLYGVADGKVSVRECDGTPASDLDESGCRALTSRWLDFAPMELEEFETKAKQWATVELTKIVSSIEDAKKSLASELRTLAEIDAILQSLPQDSTAVSDYRDRRADVVERIAKVKKVIAASEGQLEGADLLFGEKGYLRQSLVHPVVAGQATYVAVRPFVAHFLDVFKYRGSHPSQSLTDAKRELVEFRAEGLRPYCAYWSGGTGASSSLDSTREGIIRTIVALNVTDTFDGARERCKARGMELPSAQHIPGYHSHLWAGGSDTETWTATKSAKMFAETSLAKALPNFNYSGRAMKIFWTQMTWYSRYHKPGDMDAYFATPAGDAFYFNDGQDEGGVGIAAHAQPVSASWNLSVVCEKQYPRLPRYIEKAELKDCVEYSGWP